MAFGWTLLTVLGLSVLQLAADCAVVADRSSVGIDASFSQGVLADGRRYEPRAHRSSRDTSSSSDDSQDTKCRIERSHARAELANHTHAFNFTDRNPNLAMIWTGTDGKQLMALSTMEYGLFAGPSKLWISKDFGKTFESINHLIDNAIIRESSGIFKSHIDPRRVILVSYLEDMSETQTRLYITKDGGSTFQVSLAPFFLQGSIVFHQSDSDHLLAHSPYQEFKIWVSDDFGQSWRDVQSDVASYYWGNDPLQPGTLFATVSPSSESGGAEVPVYRLLRSTDYGRNFQTIRDDVYSFGVQGKFVFAASTGGEGNNDRVLHVSKDNGLTWNPTQLPVVTENRFFSVLDMNEGMIFMHVDDMGDTGSGTLYTSDGDGIVFSVSLKNHLYPEGAPSLTDFYRVLSMRGVYMASQVGQDTSIHTMITFDRGGIWQPIKAPKGSKCRNTSASCNLQIHNKYSKYKGINAPSGPHSLEGATGLILAHGNVADVLEIHSPDVFVSSDGGYNWTKALSGPYHYTITNHGGLLLAIPADEEATNIIKFSYDEGHCWNEYEFYDEPLVITGLIPEPGAQSLNVSIWGFGVEDRMWRVITIDFSAVLTSECQDKDLVEWVPHESNSRKGCLLGLSETFERVKPDSLCRLSYTHQHQAKRSSPCLCTKEDYECDYGFSRNADSEECEVSDGFDISHLDVCVQGKTEEISTWGYRKIPGDLCVNGFDPVRNVESLQKKCSQDTNLSVQQGNGAKTAAVVVLLLVVLCCGGVLFLLYRHKRLPCGRTSLPSFRYSALSSGDNLDKLIDLEARPVYHDSSDEEMLE